VMSLLRSCALLVLLVALVWGKYVRTRLNAALAQWDSAGGYRFSNIAPAEDGACLLGPDYLRL